LRGSRLYPFSGRIISFLSILLTLVLLLIIGCGNDIQPGNTAEKANACVNAKTMKISAADKPLLYEATGTVFPVTAAVISAKIMGQIKNVAVDAGSHVQKGDVLIVIDEKNIEARVAQAEAGLKQAEKSYSAARFALESASAKKKLSEKTYKRYQALLKAEAVSQQEFDQVEADYLSASAGLDQARAMAEAAKGEVARAKAALSGARAVLADTVIKAPYDAVVKEKLVDPGDMAAPGKPLLRLEKTGDFEIRTFLPESHIHSVHVGDRVTAVIETMKSAPISGTIRTIEPASDPATRTFLVKISIPSIPGLKSGLFARVRVPVGKKGMIVIPKTAIVTLGQVKGVFIVDEKHIARFRLVRTGRHFADHVEILSGLKPGERIVVKPDFSVKNNVRIQEDKL